MNDEYRQRRREEYLAKLRDPRWQRKRLEIMQRDGFRCRFCKDARSTLNVHHIQYEPNYEPWDYPANTLITLCETCHQNETEQRTAAEDDLIRALRLAGTSWLDIARLATACESLRQYFLPEEMILISPREILALAWVIETPGLMLWLCDCQAEAAEAMKANKQNILDSSIEIAP